MLKALRKKGVAKKVIWAVAIVIIISFGFLGTAYLLTGSGAPGYAGKMFGKKIPIEDFSKAYQDVRIQAIRQYGNKLNEIAHLLNLEAQTWNRMILLREAKTRKIKVSNDDVIKAISEDQSFERDGQFDPLLYNAILRNLQTRARDYEENVRDNLKIAELYKQVTASILMDEKDVLAEYTKRNEKVQISYVFVSPESFKENVSVTAPQIEQYYEDHKTEFRTPPSVNVQYLTFDFPEIEITQEPPTDENEEDEDKKIREEEQEAALEKKKDVIREKAEKVFEELLINPDMAEIASQNNMAVETSGFFSMEQPDLTLGWSYDLLNRIFQMQKGEVNEPFETPNGLSIVQIKDQRESYIPEFNEAQEKAREAVIEKEAKEIARVEAEQYLISIAEELDKSKLRDFPKAAKELDLEIHQTPEFTRGQYLPQIGISKEFQEAAFNLTEDNKVSDVVVETPTGYCILHLDNYVPIEESEFQEAKEEFGQTLVEEKRNAAFGDYVTQLRTEAELVNNIPELQAQGQ